MPKHSSPSGGKPKSSKREQEKKELLDKLKTLTPEWLAHIDKSFKAVLPCSYCDASGKASKMDELGMCLKCHGTKVVEDKDQRNWAAQEFGDRVLPKKNEVDLSMDDVREQEEAEQELGNVSDEKLNSLIAELGIKGFDGKDPA